MQLCHCSNICKHYSHRAKPSTQTGVVLRAAGSRRRRDPVRPSTAGKTEFVKAERSLMKKNRDSCPTRQTANRKADLPWEQRRHPSSGPASNTRMETENGVHSRTRAHTLAPRLSQAGCQVASGWRVCTYVPVCFSFWPALSFHPAWPVRRERTSVLMSSGRSQVPFLPGGQRTQRQVRV